MDCAVPHVDIMRREAIRIMGGGGAPAAHTHFVAREVGMETKYWGFWLTTGQWGCLLITTPTPTTPTTPPPTTTTTTPTTPTTTDDDDDEQEEEEEEEGVFSCVAMFGYTDSCFMNTKTNLS